MKKSNLVFAIALCVIFFIPSLIQVLPFGKDLGWVSCFAQSPAFLWAQRAGGTDSDYGYSCSTDANGNIIATGFFMSPTITFGTTTLTNANAGMDDMFIVKYDPNGNVLWAKSAGGTSYDEGYSCSTDASGNIIATGIFQSPSITFGITTLTNADTGDMFIVKYDPNGNVLWAKSAGGTSNDMGKSCSTDANGNVFVTGYFDSPSITFGSTTLTNAGGDDMFIVKLSGATGIEESNFENSFSVFPSPTSRYLTLTLSKGDETAEVEIYNISSQIMLKQPLIKKTTELDISGFSSGMYFVKIQNKENMKVCKVVKE